MGKISIVYLNFSPFNYTQVSIGLASIYTYLNQQHHEVKIYDTFYESECDIINSIANDGSELVGFSTTEPHFNVSIRLAEKIKRQTGKPIVFGGVFPTLEPNRCLKYEFVDYVVIGDGEYPLCQLLNGENPKSIKGVSYKVDNNITRNGVSSVFDLNAYEVTDYSGFDLKSIRSKRVFGTDTINLAFSWSSRGCAFKCTYCCNEELNQLLKYGIRHRRVENLISELELLKNKYCVDSFFLSEEDFLYDKNYVLQVAQGLIKSNNVLPFGFLTRPEHISEKSRNILVALVKAGWKWVSMGVEIGNEDKRSHLLERRGSNEIIINAFRLCHELGIKTNAFLITGFYFEDLEDIKMTFDLLRKCNPNTVECSIYFPLSGTYLGKLYENNNLVTNKDSAESYFSNCVINHPTFTPRQIKRLKYLLENYKDYNPDSLLESLSKFGTVPQCSL